jgi:hypothetical protein
MNDEHIACSDVRVRQQVIITLGMTAKAREEFYSEAGQLSSGRERYQRLYGSKERVKTYGCRTKNREVGFAHVAEGMRPMDSYVEAYAMYKSKDGSDRWADGRTCTRTKRRRSCLQASRLGLTVSQPELLRTVLVLPTSSSVRCPCMTWTRMCSLQHSRPNTLVYNLVLRFPLALEIV